MKDRIRNRIIKYARLYNENLNNKRTMFIYCDTYGAHQAIEVLCRSANYLHLTGVKTNLQANVFFNRAMGGSLSSKDFEIGNLHGVEKKLYALESIVSLHKNPTMTGDYNNSKIHLTADKIIGTEKFCLALKHDTKRDCYVPNGIYVPVSSLQDRISALVSGKPTRILAVFQKSQSDKEYSVISYIANKTDIRQLRPPRVYGEQVTKLVEAHNIASDG